MTTECPQCRNAINYDTHQGGQTIPCPHCSNSVTLAKIAAPRTVTYLQYAALLLFLIGMAMMIKGCNNYLAEERKADGNAIHQVIDVVKFAGGLVTLTLAIILHAIARLIR